MVLSLANNFKTPKRLLVVLLCAITCFCRVDWFSSQCNLCATTSANPICAVPVVSRLLLICTVDDIWDMRDAFSVPGDCARAVKEGEAALTLPYEFESLQTEVAYFVPLILHSDISCKEQLANKTELCLGEARQSSRDLEHFIYDLYRFVIAIYWETKYALQSLEKLSNMWISNLWTGITFTVPLRDLWQIVIGTFDYNALEPYRLVWIEFFDKLAEELTPLRNSGAELAVSFRELEVNLTHIRGVMLEETTKLKHKMPSKVEKWWFRRSRGRVADFETEINSLNDINLVREAAYNTVGKILVRLDDISRTINDTRLKLSRSRLRPTASLKRQIEEITSAVVDLEDVRHSMKTKRYQIARQETIKSAKKLKELENQRKKTIIVDSTPRPRHGFIDDRTDL